MTKSKNIIRIRSNHTSVENDLKCGYLFSRLVINKNCFDDTSEIDTIISEIIEKGFIFIFSEEVNGEINLVFENPYNLFIFDTMTNPELAHEESKKLLSEYMDEAVPYPYKLIPEVYWSFNENILNGGKA